MAQKFVSRNADGRLSTTITTTDSAYHYIDSLFTTGNEAGVFEVTVIGALKESSTAAVTGVLKYRYKVVNGTLTLGSVINDITPVIDTELTTTGGFTVTVVSNKVYISVKGKLSKTVVWYCTIKRQSVVIT